MTPEDAPENVVAQYRITAGAATYGSNDPVLGYVDASETTIFDSLLPAGDVGSIAVLNAHANPDFAIASFAVDEIANTWAFYVELADANVDLGNTANAFQSIEIEGIDEAFLRIEGAYTPSISGSRNEYWSWSIDASIFSSGTDYIIRLLQTPSDDIGPATDVLLLDPGGTESYVDLLWSPPQNANSAGLTHYRIRRRASITDPWIVVEDDIAFNTAFKRITALDPADNFEVELTAYGINDNTAEVVLDQTDLQTVLARGIDISAAQLDDVDRIYSGVTPTSPVRRPSSGYFLNDISPVYSLDLTTTYEGPQIRDLFGGGTPYTMINVPSQNQTILADEGVTKIIIRGVFNGNETSPNAIEEIVILNVADFIYTTVPDVWSLLNVNPPINTQGNISGLARQGRLGIFAGYEGVFNDGNEYEVFPDMKNILEPEHFVTAIEHWLTLTDRRGRLNKLPFNIIPGSRITGHTTYSNTKRKWEQYPWNPPPDGQHIVPDPYASAKPTWKQLYGYALLLQKDEIIEIYRQWTRQQISVRIYGAHDIIDELFNHQRGELRRRPGRSP